MKNKFGPPIPVIRSLYKLGIDINTARRRRRITTRLMAERTGLSRSTISKIEHGDPSASAGGYASVLFVLGMIDRFSDIADSSHDVTGRYLMDEELPKRVRIRKKE